MGARKRLLSLPPRSPKPSISGVVPRAKTSMDSPPIHQLPAERGHSCMACRGPQGISPFRRPMTSEPFPFPSRAISPPSPLGRWGVRRRRKPNPPSRFSAITSMNAAANSCTAALAPSEKLMTVPSAPTAQPVSV